MLTRSIIRNLMNVQSNRAALSRFRHERANGLSSYNCSQVNQNNVRKELTLQEAILCNDKSAEPKTAQRGDYWVLYNYVPMSMKVSISVLMQVDRRDEVVHFHLHFISHIS